MKKRLMKKLFRKLIKFVGNKSKNTQIFIDETHFYIGTKKEKYKYLSNMIKTLRNYKSGL